MQEQIRTRKHELLEYFESLEGMRDDLKRVELEIAMHEDEVFDLEKVIKTRDAENYDLEAQIREKDRTIAHLEGQGKKIIIRRYSHALFEKLDRSSDFSNMRNSNAI